MKLRIQKYIALFSILLLVAKLWAWYLSGSFSILTDALESIVNVITGFIGLYSLYLAQKPKDANHPYGHGKVEYIAAGIEGTFIILSACFILFELGASFFTAHQLQQLDLGILLTAITGLLNYIISIYANRVAQKDKSATLEAAATHLKVDAYSSFAVVSGLCLVLLFQWYWLDKLIALVLAILIFIAGYKVLRKALAAIMDEADEQLLEAMLKIINQHRNSNWIDLHNLRTIQYGEVLHIDAHLTLPWYWQVKRAEETIDEFEALIEKEFGSSIECFVHVDPCRAFSCPICTIENCAYRQEPFQQQKLWTLQNIRNNAQHRKQNNLDLK